MSQVTRLVRPDQAQLRINATPNTCPSDGFNWPSFRQLNKKGRVALSPEPIFPDPFTAYRLFAVANSKGWFASAVRQSGDTFSLVFSPLDELRSVFRDAKQEYQPFASKRILSLNSEKPNILAFSSDESRLFVSLEKGQLLVFDTAALFTSGSDHIQPRYQNQTGPLNQVLPNPGSESSLADIVAVVGAEGVALFNAKLEPQGGWVAESPALAPVTIAWSPKGKHIAIGLQSGDILTYPLTNKSTFHKHVPPTANASLVSLSWLAPGHTFKTTYSPSAGSPADVPHHIIPLDPKAATATYYSPNYPFPLSNRPRQQAFTAILQRWDEEAASSTSKSLVIVGDKSSVDFEVLGNIDTRWFQQSQENPVTLPLDKEQADTILLSLETDLTDKSTACPVVYAYLSDGTLQGWTLDHNQPYVGIVGLQFPTPADQSMSGTPATTQNLSFGQASFTSQQPAFTSSFAPSTGSNFIQHAAPAFGSTGFGQKPLSGFNATSPSATSTFGPASHSPLGAPPESAFSQISQATASAPFGNASALQFGGGSSFKTTPFESKPTGFGNVGFGSGLSTTTGAFGAFANKSGNASVFGQTSFGFGTSPSSGNSVSSNVLELTREASMADGTTSEMGGLSLGGESGIGLSEKPSIFGSIAPASTVSAAETPSAGHSVFKPAAGFGAFSNFKPAQSVTEAKSDKEPKVNPGFAKPQSGFGQPSFGISSLGQPAFGQSSFGVSSFGKPSTNAPSGSEGFGRFASSSSTAFGEATASPTTSPAGFPTTAKPATGGVFAAFATGAPSAFGVGLGSSITTNTFLPTVPSTPITDRTLTALPGPSDDTALSGMIALDKKTPKKGDIPSSSPTPKLGNFEDNDRTPVPRSAARTPPTGSFPLLDFSSIAAKVLKDESTNEHKKVEVEKDPISIFPPAPKVPPISVFSTTPLFKPKEEDKDKKEILSEAHREDEKAEFKVGGSSVASLSKPKTTSDESFGNLSSITGSSFAEVDFEHADSEEGTPSEDEVSDGEEYVYDGASARGSFSSSGDLSDVPEEDEETDEGDSEVGKYISPVPTNIPLPPSRSATPQVEVPKTEIASPSIPTTFPPSSPQEPPSKAKPANVLDSPLELLAPPRTSSAPPSTTQTYHHILGRLSTRPTRSSPLTSTPVSSGDNDEERNKRVIPLKSVLLCVEKPLQKPLKGEEDTLKAIKERPKTPPLFSKNFFSSVTPALKPSSNLPVPFSLFTKAELSTPPVPSGTLSPSPSGLFGVAGRPSSVFGDSASLPKPAVGMSSGIIPGFDTRPPPNEHSKIEDGMQKECARLVEIMQNELTMLRQVAEGCKMQLEVNRSHGGSRNRVELGILEKWALDDAVQFGQTLLQFENELDEMQKWRNSQKSVLKEMESNMLKATTRKEEISRFHKARTDKEFGRVLKSRTLGPEHLETQTQLRRNIRAVRDRVQKLEDCLMGSKKMLNERKSGQPSLKAPTLDTINRTYRNIDLAIQQQSSDIDQLVWRLNRLNITVPVRSSPSPFTFPKGRGELRQRDPRLPDSLERPRGYAMTKHVAITTAAALNAERSAHRLKRALSEVRQVPLLNTKAVTESLVPTQPYSFRNAINC